MDKIFIFGHRKPDTDSVTSAIALSYLKNKLGYNTEARILSNINDETKFVLNYFKVDVPKYLNDVKLQIKDIDYLKGHTIDNHISVFDCYNYMSKYKISTIPITDSDKNYIGAISMKDIAKDTINGNYENLLTSYDNIIAGINAKQLLKFDDEIVGKIIVASYRSTTFIDSVNLNSDSILIVGDRHSIIEFAINKKIKMLILTGNVKPKSEHIKLAKENKVNIITTQLDTFSVTKRIGLCNYVTNINYDKNVTTVFETDYLNDFVDLVNKTRFTNYPVLNKNKKCLGTIGITDTSNKKKKKVILVDHNELEQTVENIEDAEIIEIIDHHKIGSIGTTVPINFRNMPVGSTNTIIYTIYKENRIKIPKKIAGIMLAGILSDTLIFKSPTTTSLDISTSKDLSKIAGVNYKSFGILMFKEGINLKNKTCEEILFADFKNFVVEGEKIGIGQVSTTCPEEILNNELNYVTLLNGIEQDKDYFLVCLFITDIMNNCSYCIYNTKSKSLLSYAFNKDFIQGICLPKILSRKKQIIPAIMNVIEKR